MKLQQEIRQRTDHATAKNFDIINKFPVFNQFKMVLLEDMTLLGAPILAERAVDAALKGKTAILEKSIKRLSVS